MNKTLWLASIVILGALTLAAWAWAGVRAAAQRHYRESLEQAKHEIAAQRYGKARKRLIEMAPGSDADGAINYELGICELSLGHPDRALAAWEAVPAGGPFAARAALRRAMVAIESGHLTRAEQILQAAIGRSPTADAPELLRGLQLLFHIQGRPDDVRRAIIESWAYSEKPAEVVKQLSRLDGAPLPLEKTRQVLAKAPEDDARGWLGRANLAIRTGQFDRAAESLDLCSRHGAEDLPVWRARLLLSQAAGDLASTWRALEHIPADALSATELLRLRAWLASRIADTAAERAALGTLIEIEPGDTAALDRLAALAIVDRDDNEVARLRARKSEMMAAHSRYRALLQGDSIGDPAELARLAERLGRRIEANGWSLIRDGKADKPGQSRPALVPVDLAGGPTAFPPGRSLAERCADLRRDRSEAASDRSAMVVPAFVDDARSSGLRFIHDNGASAVKRLPETMSGGVGLLDYDGDGWLDIYAVQGGPFPPPTNPPCLDRLYRNRRDGTFEDVSDRAGIDKIAGGYGHGVAVGDFDNDGRPDLFVTRWKAYVLLRNAGDGTFEDVTARAGLGGDRDWPTSAAWADLDSDGDLDLYVCHYLVFNVENSHICTDAKSGANHYCSPRDFPAIADHVFRNDGGRFVDVTEAAGFIDADGRGLGVIAADLDDDNKIDIYVANDMSANYLFHNSGGFRFTETAFPAGAAVNSGGGFQSGMGVACGDLDGDGRPDLAVTNYYGESTTLFRNLGRGLFADETAATGLAAPSRNTLGFGIAFLDANNDGRLDLISANGHVSNYEPVFPWKMPVQLLMGDPAGRLTDISARAGPPFRPLHLGRGLAAGDLDNDGRVDTIVQSQNEPLAYFHNHTAGNAHWVTFRLEGVRSNRDGVGATVTVEAGGRGRSAQRFGGGVTNRRRTRACISAWERRRVSNGWR